MKFQFLWNTLKYAVAISLLAYVVCANWDPAGGRGLKDVWERHVVQGQPIHGYFLVVGFVIFLGSVLITLLRWYVLVCAQDMPFTLGGAMRIGLIGFFFNTFLPGSVGGDIIKAAALAREQRRRTVAVATVIMDRVIALWGLVWFVALLGGSFWAFGWLDGATEGAAKSIVLSAMGIVGGSVIVWLLLGLLPQYRAEHFAGRLSRIPKVGGPAAEFWRAVWMYRCRQQSVALALILAWVGHIGFVVAFYCCSRNLLGSVARQSNPDAGRAFSDRANRPGHQRGAAFPGRGGDRRGWLWRPVCSVRVPGGQRRPRLAGAARPHMGGRRVGLPGISEHAY